MSTNVKNVPASEIRAWGRTQPDFAGQNWLNDGARGVIPVSARDAFRKEHKGRKVYEPTLAEHATVEVPGVVGIDKAGRKTTKTVTLPTSEARTLLGQPTSRKGRLSKRTLAEALSAQNANAVADTFTK
jgi:hypothetical protein